MSPWISSIFYKLIFPLPDGVVWSSFVISRQSDRVIRSVVESNFCAVFASAMKSLGLGVALTFTLILTNDFASAGGTLNLEFTGCNPGGDLTTDQVVDGGQNGKLTLGRLDFLMSGLALQRVDGTWLESRDDWTASISVGKRRLSALTDGVLDGEYQAIRFRVGVSPKTDLIDPAIYPPDHPLHPDVCGLHWSWQGGYIYMAVEGQSSGMKNGASGFSFHLAREGNAQFVEIPVRFRGGGPITIQIGMDPAAILAGIDFSRDGNSTHSRDGDPIVGRMKINLTRAFRSLAVKYDIFQQPGYSSATLEVPITAGAKLYRLDISQRFPKVQLPADNLLTEEGVALGNKLFHEKRLSVNDSQSCSSCHQQESGFSDPRRFSLGAEGHPGKRRSMPLVNLAWQKSFFWDGRAPSIREQVLMPISDPHEMNEKPEHVITKLAGDPTYVSDFRAAFGSTGITVRNMALALEQFLITNISQDSRFDRALRKQGELTETEKRGLQLFVTEHDPDRGLRGADCFHCHGGMLFTDHELHDNGLTLADADAGRMSVTGQATDFGKFKTPSLRNVVLRPPYMHDGRFATLEEVVEHYNSGVQRRPTLDPNLAKHPLSGLGLTDDEKSELVAFLRTLTDNDFSAPKILPAASPPP
jgi:cytochrome c peroxidase